MIFTDLKQRMYKLVSRATTICMVLLISGCSTFSFVFERLDWFTVWRLDAMFDLTEQQEALVKPDVVALQQWIKTEGFPQTIDQLNVLLKYWQNDELALAYRHLTTSLDNLNALYLRASKEGVVRFSLTLTEENASHYREYTQEKQADWFDSLESVEAKFEHEIDRLEDWFGRLNDQQISLVKSRIVLVDNELQIRIDNLTNWREAYLQAAIRRDTDLVSAWLDDVSIFWTPEYAALKQYNDQVRDEFILELLPSLSTKQKKHAQEYVEDWIEKLKDVLPED